MRRPRSILSHDQQARRGVVGELARHAAEHEAPRGALLACPPGEQHELGLLCFGLLLHQRGWRVAYLGAETPASDLAAAIAELSPELVVLAATSALRFVDSADGIRALSAQARLAIGGAGASEAVARSLGAELLADDLVAAARALSGAASVRARGDG